MLKLKMAQIPRKLDVSNTVSGGNASISGISLSNTNKLSNVIPHNFVCVYL